jgi:hypothetical protein
MAVSPEVVGPSVSRSGALWVAAITAVGGFATAVVTGAIGLVGKSKPPVVQRWIRIAGVELSKDAALPPIDRVRLVAQVNGVSYSYPTSVNSIWAPVGPGMIGERYPLPIGAESYRVKFFGFGSNGDSKVAHYEYRGLVEHSLSHVPFQGATQALQFTTSDRNGLEVGMTVRYSIE